MSCIIFPSKVKHAGRGSPIHPPATKKSDHEKLHKAFVYELAGIAKKCFLFLLVVLWALERGSNTHCALRSARTPLHT